MLTLIVYYAKYFITVLVAPFYFHFGYIALLGDVVIFLFNIIDILATYYVVFTISIIVMLFKNSIFRTLAPIFFKSQYFTLIYTFLMNFFSKFLTTFKKIYKTIRYFFYK